MESVGHTIPLVYGGGFPTPVHHFCLRIAQRNDMLSIVHRLSARQTPKDNAYEHPIP